jgi:RNA polymerase sigma factor (sigma-70 family)
VERTARRFSGLESQDDLVQVGFIGLLNALGKFDPNANVRFNTYATYLVAGEIKHYLRDGRKPSASPPGSRAAAQGEQDVGGLAPDPRATGDRARDRGRSRSERNERT